MGMRATGCVNGIYQCFTSPEQQPHDERPGPSRPRSHCDKKKERSRVCVPEGTSLQKVVSSLEQAFFMGNLKSMSSAKRTSCRATQEGAPQARHKRCSLAATVRSSVRLGTCSQCLSSVLLSLG